MLATYDDEIAIALLEAGADRNAKDEEGKTIGDKAVNNGTARPRLLAWLRARPVRAR